METRQFRELKSKYPLGRRGIGRFNDQGLGEVIGEEKIDTKRLDDISEIKDIDFLKIDVQGSELTIFMNGRKKLGNAVAIQTEISFVSLYGRSLESSATPL